MNFAKKTHVILRLHFFPFDDVLISFSIYLQDGNFSPKTSSGRLFHLKASKHISLFFTFTVLFGKLKESHFDFHRYRGGGVVGKNATLRFLTTSHGPTPISMSVLPGSRLRSKKPSAKARSRREVGPGLVVLYRGFILPKRPSRRWASTNWAWGFPPKGVFAMADDSFLAFLGFNPPKEGLNSNQNSRVIFFVPGRGL